METDYKKLYKEALERARNIRFGNPNSATANVVCEEIFPELKESEDERTRKELIDLIKDIKGQARHVECYDRYLAWLEKQGEKKSTIQYNYVKFREGDTVQKITGDKDIVTIAEVDIEAEEYKLTNTGFIPFKYEHLWHIVKQNPAWSKEDITNYSKVLFCLQTLTFPTDAERKELITWLKKQYEQSSADGECKAKREAEQKPTQEVESFEAEHGKYYYCIKDYFCGGRKQASKGDVVQALRGLPIMGLKDASEYFLPVNNVQNPAWSEENEELKNSTILYMQGMLEGAAECENIDDIKEFNKIISWLKSIKDRVQPHWKPTDEQLQTLKDTINHDAACTRVDVLESLYNDLKKL